MCIGNLSALSGGYLNTPEVKQYPVWIAQYYRICQYDEPYVGWQYASDGKVPGIKGDVDMNVW